MNLDETMKQDWADIIYGDFAEAITYNAVAMQALIDRNPIRPAYFEDGDGEAAQITVRVTDNATLGYTGVTAPAAGDTIVADGETWRVFDIGPRDQAGVWVLTAKRYDKAAAGSGRRKNLDRG